MILKNIVQIVALLIVFEYFPSFWIASGTDSTWEGNNMGTRRR